MTETTTTLQPDTRPKGRVVVALSGGVDSSVAAALLHEAGYEVIGVTMRLWTAERDDVPDSYRGCCGVEEVDDARRVCDTLGVPYRVLNFERAFRTQVVDDFIDAYRHGRTPNPCLNCNRYLKFDALFHTMEQLEADYVATGHYARIDQDPASGRWRLWRAADPDKDQSYVLYPLGQAALSRLLFPIGGLTKAATRAHAERFGLITAHKRESQDICFVTQGDYRRFLREQGVDEQPGAIVDQAGRQVGRHQGVPFYTIGQRKGLGLAAPVPLYVTGLDPARNTVTVGPEAALLRRTLSARDAHFVADELPAEPIAVEAKIRYRTAPAAAVVAASGPDAVAITFAEPQRAVTPGQAVVFYRGEEVLGGGTIAA